MMNAALREQQQPYVYLAYDIAPEHLAEAVQGMKRLGFQGWNVTVPHKIAIMDHLDEVDPIAQAIGAVNTVYNRNGRWIGTNTDGRGYLLSLPSTWKETLPDQHVVLIGAGGAARAVGYTLAQEGVRRMTILNRTLSKAESLAQHLSQWCSHVEAVALTSLQASDAVSTSTFIINTTSVGMHPHTDEIPIDPQWLPSKGMVSDLIYAPMKTALLQAAEAKGLAIHNGQGMLLYQAVIAYEHWIEQTAPVETMQHVLLQEMNADEDRHTRRDV
jgi:shikimate dehydrogenase